MSGRNTKSTPGISCLKFLLIVFTIIFCIIGIGLLGVGIYSKIQLTSYILLSTTHYQSAPYVMIGFGAFIILVGLIGCLATAKSNTCLLRTYALILGAIFIAELVGAIAVVILRGKISDGFEKGMVVAMVNYNTSTDYKTAVDKAQSTLHCCGVDNFTDYWTMANWTMNVVPGSCCNDSAKCGKMEVIHLPSNVTEAKKLVFNVGCPNLVFGIVDHNFGIIIGSIFGVACFQLLGLVLSCCLASNINSNKYELV